MAKIIKPVHPGEILKEEFLDAYGISQYRLAVDISVAPIRVSEMVRGIRAISTDTALRLGKYFGNSPEFWLNLQLHYDLALETKLMSDVLRRQVKIFKTANV
ncbi:MAG: HigA family addiction module antitoxin [Candidatus Falkowbacteria bacterium]